MFLLLLLLFSQRVHHSGYDLWAQWGYLYCDLTGEKTKGKLHIFPLLVSSLFIVPTNYAVL